MALLIHLIQNNRAYEKCRKFSFGFDFIGKSKEFYNPLKPIYYIPMHKERDKDHKLHDNDLILPSH
jgi:hypothetical protein